MKKWMIMGGKQQMKGRFKRSAVVATVLVFVCAAVYINWRYSGNVADQVAVKNSGDSGSTRVLGDAELVDGKVVSDDSVATGYFDSARLSRQQSRDNALSLLREAGEQENVEQATLDEANRAIQTLAGYTMLENQIENLVIAKGYADCVTFMGDNGVSVVVSAAEDGLQTEDVAKIMDIVLTETNYTADQVKILEAE